MGRNKIAFCSGCLHLSHNGYKTYCEKLDIGSPAERLARCGGQYRETSGKRHFKPERERDFSYEHNTTLMMTREELYAYFESRKKFKYTEPQWK